MVIKFNPEGRVAWCSVASRKPPTRAPAPLKHPKPPLPPVDGMFRQVTDVAWDAAGNTYISDGYINSRVAKVDKDGNWLKSWGEPGSGPGQFNTPHSIAIDAQRQRLRRRPRQPAHPGVRRRRQLSPPDHHRRACAARRSARDRQQAGEAESPRAPWRPAAPWAICITPPPDQVLFASDAFPGRIYKLSLDGKVLGMLGQLRQAAQTIRLDSRDGLPEAERALRGRATELASAEASARLTVAFAKAVDNSRRRLLWQKVRPRRSPASPLRPWSRPVCQFDPDRRMVARLLPASHIAVDAGRLEARRH